MDDIELDLRVRDLLGVKPGESINEAAYRVAMAPMTSVQLHVACAILAPDGSPWERMREAARRAEAP